MQILSPREAYELSGHINEAFENPNTEQDEDFDRLVVDVVDDDGYAGHMSQLRFVGLVRQSGIVTLEIDYPNLNKRLWCGVELDTQAGVIEGTQARDGEKEVISLDPNGLFKIMKWQAIDARYGTPYKSIMSDKDAQFQHDLLKSAVAVEA